MAAILTIGEQTFSLAGEGGDIEVTSAEYLTLVGWAAQQTQLDEQTTALETLEDKLEQLRIAIARKA